MHPRGNLTEIKLLCCCCCFPVRSLIEIGLSLPLAPLSIHLFSLYVLFSQCRSCDNTLENCFFQTSSYQRAYLRITYEKTKSQVPLGPYPVSRVSFDLPRLQGDRRRLCSQDARTPIGKTKHTS